MRSRDERTDLGRYEPVISALRVDRITAEVVGAFDRAGVRSVLLKGPTFATWLYGDGSARLYVDSDLLVAPDDHERAEEVLRALGFEISLSDHDTPGWRLNAHGWIRADGAQVDLHRSVIGLGASPAEVWSALAPELDSMRVGGRSVPILSLAARTLHVALHAAQHGTGGTQQIDDLRRAIALVDRAVWERAAELATRLHAEPAFYAGLAMTPEGRALATDLGATSASRSREATLRAGAPPRGALGIEELARAPGLRAKAVMVMRNLVPRPGHMRAWSPLARRGRFGLALTYVWRPLAVIARLGPALASWIQAERKSRASSSPAGGESRERS
jgi:hypothetical protein